MPIIFIADNGSTKADATLQLRQLANKLGEKTGQQVFPVSFQHAQRIPAQKLEGRPAQVFSDFMAQKLAEGHREFLLLPLFFGQSKAITSFIPEQLAVLKPQYGEFTLDIADVIYPLPQGEPLLESIIHDHILQTAHNSQQALDNIVLVDHGSPLPQVTVVRKKLAQGVQKKLPGCVKLEQAVMERRAGKEYDFNGDLLEQWLTDKAEAGAKGALVILQFFLAGRHAGAEGDIVEICAEVMRKYPEFKIAISPLISKHPALVDILQSRMEKVLLQSA